MVDLQDMVRDAVLGVLTEAKCVVSAEQLRVRAARRIRERHRGGTGFTRDSRVRVALNLALPAARGLAAAGRLSAVRLVEGDELVGAYSLAGCEKPRAGSGDRVLVVEDGDAPRLAAAIHEAGHAVVAQAFGGIVERVAAHADGGGAFRIGLREQEDVPLLEQAACVHYAGAAAERRFLKAPHPSCVADDEKAAARTRLPRHRLDEMRKCAARIIEFRGREVLLTAAELFTRGRLSGGRTMNLYEQARRSLRRSPSS